MLASLLSAFLKVWGNKNWLFEEVSFKSVLWRYFQHARFVSLFKTKYVSINPKTTKANSRKGIFEAKLKTIKSGYRRNKRKQGLLLRSSDL